MNISTHKTQSTLSKSLEGTHMSETVNPTSDTHQHMHSEVKHDVLSLLCVVMVLL